jgi:hypothetical protein
MTDLATVYHKHLTQRVPSDPYWQYNCAAYATAMAVNDSVLGGLSNVTGQRIRALSSEPIPDPTSPGLNVSQCVAAAGKLGVRMYRKQEPWHVLRNRVGSGASRALLPVHYDSMDPFGCQSAGDFGHMLLVVLFDGDRVRASDPLCDVTKWYPENVLRRAAETFVNGTTITYAVTRVVPKVGG